MPACARDSPALLGGSHMRAVMILCTVLMPLVAAGEASAGGDTRSSGARGARARPPAAATPARTGPSEAQARTGTARISGRAVASSDARHAAARYLCPRGGQPQRGGRCRGAGAYAEDGGGLRWQAGLPPAEHGQRECPDGTLATLARGHTDVVRCVPL